MDTVRYDRTSLAGGRDTTPNLARLANRGVSFGAAYAVGNESLYSHAALLTGRYPSEVCAPDYATYAIPDGTPTLARLLGSAGYRTAAYTGGGHLVAPFGFDEGFDTFTAPPGDTRFGSFFDSVPSALAWIRAQPEEQPWFAFVHGYDAHSPYMQRGPFKHLYGEVGASQRVERIVANPTAVEQLRGARWFPDRTPTDFVHASGRTVLGTDFYALPAEPVEGERSYLLEANEIAHLRDHYDTGLTYADLWLGVLLEGVDLDRTLVIVVSDHGEDLLDHGYMNHRAGLWDSTLHVPLVVAGPGFSAGERRAGMVDLRDVVPTVLSAVGAAIPGGLSGTPLQVPQGRTAVFAEGVMDRISVRTETQRLSVHRANLSGNNGTSVVGSDAAGSDAVGSGDASRALLDALRVWQSGLVQGPQGAGAAPAALKDALQQRGYWEPASAEPPATAIVAPSNGP